MKIEPGALVIVINVFCGSRNHDLSLVISCPPQHSSSPVWSSASLEDRQTFFGYAQVYTNPPTGGSSCHHCRITVIKVLGALNSPRSAKIRTTFYNSFIQWYPPSRVREWPSETNLIYKSNSE